MDSLEKTRLARRMVFAALLAFGVSMCLMLLLKNPGLESILLCAVMAAAAALSVLIFWKELIKSGETRLKGGLYGAFAGFVAVYFAGVFIGIYSCVFMIAEGEASADKLGNALIIIPIFIALFGSMIAVPIGAIFGFTLSKNQTAKVSG